MHFDPVDIFFQIIVLLFAICVHESAHAWMANRLGDPTAKMLGRVSLNPIVHIDPFGTIIMPLLLILAGLPAVRLGQTHAGGHSKFQEPDARRHSYRGRRAGQQFPDGFSLRHRAGDHCCMDPVRGIGQSFRGADVAAPLAKLFSFAILINVVLGVFNLIPLPPLDGSHVIRHFLSYDTLRVYDGSATSDSSSCCSFLPMIGCSIVNMLITPFLAFFYALLNQLLRF